MSNIRVFQNKNSQLDITIEKCTLRAQSALYFAQYHAHLYTQATERRKKRLKIIRKNLALLPH